MGERNQATQGREFAAHRERRLRVANGGLWQHRQCLAHAGNELLAPGLGRASGEADVLRAEVHRCHLGEPGHGFERMFVDAGVRLLPRLCALTKIIS